MSTNSKTSIFQTALILGAMVAGGLVTRMVPERRPFAAYVPPTHVIPTTAVFKHANAGKQDTSRDLTGIDVDIRRLALLGRIS
ncbi:MAG: hypothetical protein AB7G28_14870 [Pirellulales bacterium]